MSLYQYANCIVSLQTVFMVWGVLFTVTLAFLHVELSSFIILLTSLAVQFYLGFCSIRGMLAARLASC